MTGHGRRPRCGSPLGPVLPASPRSPAANSHRGLGRSQARPASWCLGLLRAHRRDHRVIEPGLPRLRRYPGGRSVDGPCRPGRAHRGHDRVTSGRVSASGCPLESGGKVRARTDVELLECVSQVRRDGARCHVQPLGYGAVAVPAGGQLGDAVLGRGERTGTAERAASGAGAHRVELLTRPPGQQQHATTICLLERVPERDTGVRPPVGSPQRGAEGDQGAGVLKAGRGSR